eukprot:scaffold51082_cov30-Tisochrysis_lutea.AAC.4
MARNIHGRYIDSHFMGESHEAYEANIRFFHAVAFCFLMQFRNPQVPRCQTALWHGCAQTAVELGSTLATSAHAGHHHVGEPRCNHEVSPSDASARAAPASRRARAVAGRARHVPLQQSKAAEADPFLGSAGVELRLLRREHAPAVQV